MARGGSRGDDDNDDDERNIYSNKILRIGWLEHFYLLKKKCPTNLNIAAAEHH